MRSAIMMCGIFISDSLGGLKYSEHTLFFIASIFVIFMIMDVIDFLFNK